MKPAVICYVLFYVISFWARPTASLTFNKGGGREERAALLLLVQSWPGPVIFWFFELLLPMYMLIYNPIQHKHSAAASLVITRPIHTQQAAMQAEPSWHI